jgi:hypothetical protein
MKEAPKKISITNVRDTYAPIKVVDVEIEPAAEQIRFGKNIFRIPHDKINPQSKSWIH